jgi:hypothetical protein
MMVKEKEYDTYVDSLGGLRQGEEIELSIRDLETYEFRVVKAIVSSSKEKLPGGDTLWIRLMKGKMVTKEPWTIKITKELGSLLEKQISQGS